MKQRDYIKKEKMKNRSLFGASTPSKTQSLSMKTKFRWIQRKVENKIHFRKFTLEKKDKYD